MALGGIFDIPHSGTSDWSFPPPVHSLARQMVVEYRTSKFPKVSQQKPTRRFWLFVFPEN